MITAAAPGVRWVIEKGESIWIPDRESDERFYAKALIETERPRFYAAAPIRLAHGLTVGALRVAGLETRAYDADLAARLQDLADGVADECDRARATEAAAHGERELRRARSVLSAFVNTIPVSVVMTDRELRVLRATPRWLSNFKLAEHEAIGRSLYDVSPAYFERFRQLFERSLGGEVVRRERVGSVNDSRRDWLEIEMTPWYDDSGEVGGLVSAEHDITEMVRAVRTAERAQERLQLATQVADIHVYEVDYARRSIETAGAIDLPEDSEANDLDLQLRLQGRRRQRRPARPTHRRGSLARRYEEDGVPYTSEHRVARSDGAEVWASDHMHMIKDERGKIVRIIGAMQNVTQRKHAELALIQAKEDAEAANRAKSAFLATMSHEIRTPLNGVLGMAQAMAAHALDPAQGERLDVIRRSGEALLAILNDVLDLSKIEAGKLELEETLFDIGELASGAHAAFSAVASEKNIGFDLNVSQAAEGVYLGDSTRVRQVLFNLISNALKFTDQGAVSVNVGRRKGALLLTVRDSGIGMSPLQQRSLFRKFEQADASTTRRFGGTGLGLAICREMTSIMGGSISVRSNRAGARPSPSPCHLRGPPSGRPRRSAWSARSCFSPRPPRRRRACWRRRTIRSRPAGATQEPCCSRSASSR